MINEKTINYVNKAKLIHKDVYDYSLVIYTHPKIKIKIICIKHGIFEQAPYSHLQGRGCPNCGGTIKSNSFDFIEKAKLIHGDCFGYSSVDYINNASKVKILCIKHNEFEQTPNDHLSGKGCPICKESKGERDVRNYLEKNNIKYIRQYKFIDCKFKKPLPFDFYLSDYNICVEYDGIQHYEPVKRFGGINNLKIIQEKDKIKKEFCVNNNIILIRIKYNEPIEMLETKLKPILNKK